MLRGINYDVGTPFKKGTLSRPVFDELVVKKEIEIIRHDLHCDAIRISGCEVGRLSRASEFALEAGLQVWFSPACPEATGQETISYLTDCAVAAEVLRRKYPNIIFVAGCEYSLFLSGFVKGTTLYERMENLFRPWNMVLNMLGLKKSMHRNLNRFLSDAAQAVKSHFGGQLTYAAGTWEKIDWELFDIVGIDHYLASFNKSFYLKQLQGYYKFNKPVAVLEFGCCAYRGAAEKGPMGWAITEVDASGKTVIRGKYQRDESEQARYITGVLDLLKKENVFGAFVFTFVNPMYKHSDEPTQDLDLASLGIVKPLAEGSGDSYKGMPWVAKDAFYRLSAYYSQMNKNA